MNKKITVLVLIIVAVSIFVIFSFKGMQKTDIGIPNPKLPKSGEKMQFKVFAQNLNGVSVENVEVMITDENRSETWRNVTNKNGTVGFFIIVGNTYSIKASFHNSTKSVTSSISPKDRLYIFVENQSIKAVKIEEVGIT